MNKVTSGRTAKTGQANVVWGQIAVATLMLLIWQYAEPLGIVRRSALPSPIDVGRELIQLLASPGLWTAISQTLYSWAVGLGISLFLGTTIGMVVGASPKLVVATRFIVDFFRSVPSVALVPVAVLLFGSSLKMKLLIIVFTATWDMLVQALYAVRQIDPLRRDTLRIYKVDGLDRIKFLIAPSALPFLLTGVRIAATHALMLAIGAEIIGSAGGLGQQLTIAQDSGAMPTMYAFLIVVGVIGVLVNKGSVLLQNRVLYWHADYREGTS